MTLDTAGDDKSCDPQLLFNGEPSNEWGLDELGIYAQLQDRQITDGEKLLTPSYWRLGHALTLAKKAFNHGQWSKYLEELGIDKTRASRARAIYRTFDEEADVAGLTVAEAYARRRKKTIGKPEEDADGAATCTEDVRRLRKSVTNIAQQTGTAIQDAAFVASEEAAILIPAVRNAIGQLQELLAFLEEQAAAVPAGSEQDEPESEEARQAAAK